MNSAFRTNPFTAAFPHFQALRGLAAALGLACLAASHARAEDPLLGRIKVIQCVGCTPGAVNLIVHDPIDVRDFEVQIKESDYQKIVTPLAGKTIYDKEGCFYWMEYPKRTGKPLPVRPPKETGSAGRDSDSLANPGTDTTGSAPGASVTAVEAAPQPEGKPSRCIPFIRILIKPAKNDAGRGDKDE